MDKRNLSPLPMTRLDSCLAWYAFLLNLKGRITSAKGEKIEILPLDGGLASSSIEQLGVGGKKSGNILAFFGFRSF